jgi:CRISPR/Cas system-associated endonuclease Cas1
MLVTISGIVGSGKTTVTKQILRELESRGTAVTYLRFQSLPCFTVFRRSFYSGYLNRTGADRAQGNVAISRGVGHQRQTLTTLTYIARILAFRSTLSERSGRCRIAFLRLRCRSIARWPCQSSRRSLRARKVAFVVSLGCLENTSEYHMNNRDGLREPQWTWGVSTIYTSNSIAW